MPPEVTILLIVGGVLAGLLVVAIDRAQTWKARYEAVCEWSACRLERLEKELQAEGQKNGSA